MFRSIRWRLVASYVVLALLTVSVVGVLAIEIVRRSIQQQELFDLHASAQVIAYQASPLLWPVPQPQELSQLVRTAAFLADVHVRILDPELKVLADSGPPAQVSELVWVSPPTGIELQPHSSAGEPPVVVFPQFEPLSITQLQLSILESLPPGTSLRVIRRSYGTWGSRFSFENYHQEMDSNPTAQPDQNTKRSDVLVTLPLGDTEKPFGYVELSGAPDYTTGALNTIRQALLLAGAGAAATAAVLGIVISQRLTSPLRSLQETAERMGAGELSVRAPITNSDEIGELAQQFNTMAQRLERSFTQLADERDALRRFIADASHELRTPITALKNFITLLQSPALADQQTQSEFLAESQAQIERLEWITGNLLDLSRIEAGLVELDIAEHELADLLESSLAPFKSQAAEKGITLSLQVEPQDLKISIDRDRLEMAITNLLDNAIKFSSPGGMVELGANGDEKSVRIWIRDHGVGIQPDDLPHIFDRFYQGKNAKKAGTGLGLAIASGLVQAQGGQIKVESTPGEGTTFILEWSDI